METVMERTTYIGEDGLLHCSVCKEPVEAVIQMPTFDGTGGKYDRKVRIKCKCEVEEEKKREEHEQFEQKQAKIKELHTLSLIDSKLVDASFENFEVNGYNANAFKLAKKYAENFETMYKIGQGLLLYGNVGTGKSYTAAAISNYLIDHLQPVIMTSFVKVLSDTKSFMKDEEMYLKRLDVAKLLVIDDFGAERATDYALERVYNLIDSRYRSGKPLIITTNVDFADMKNCDDIRYERIYDRLFAMCRPVKLSGPSWRRKEATERYDAMNKILEG